jgi:hypothetical protein
MKPRSLHLLVALALLTAAGIVHGMWTNRWATGAMVDGKNLLAGVDAGVGDWQAGEFLKIDPAELPAGTRCESRRFQSPKAGKPIAVSITSGNPGAVAVHTPDVCFLGAGWKLRGGVAQQTIPLSDGQSASFYMADFTKTSATGSETIRVRWSWSADGKWEAPSYPRLVFARAPILYKFYLVHPLNEENDLTREDPYRKFAADLMPILSRQFR